MRKTNYLCKIYTAKDFPIPEPPVLPSHSEVLLTVVVLLGFIVACYSLYLYISSPDEVLNKSTDVLIAGNKKIINDLQHSLDLSTLDTGKDSLNSVVPNNHTFVDANVVSSAVETITDVIIKT